MCSRALPAVPGRTDPLQPRRCPEGRGTLGRGGGRVPAGTAPTAPAGPAPPRAGGNGALSPAKRQPGTPCSHPRGRESRRARDPGRWSRRGWLGMHHAVPGKTVRGCPTVPERLGPRPLPRLSAVPHGHCAGAGGSGRHSPALPALPREPWATTGGRHGQAPGQHRCPHRSHWAQATHPWLPLCPPRVPVWPCAEQVVLGKILHLAPGGLCAWLGVGRAHSPHSPRSPRSPHSPRSPRSTAHPASSSHATVINDTSLYRHGNGDRGTEGWGPRIPLQQAALLGPEYPVLPFQCGRELPMSFLVSPSPGAQWWGPL